MTATLIFYLIESPFILYVLYQAFKILQSAFKINKEGWK